MALRSHQPYWAGLFCDTLMFLFTYTSVSSHNQWLDLDRIMSLICPDPFYLRSQSPVHISPWRSSRHTLRQQLFLHGWKCWDWLSGAQMRHQVLCPEESYQQELLVHPLGWGIPTLWGNQDPIHTARNEGLLLLLKSPIQVSWKLSLDIVPVWKISIWATPVSWQQSIGASLLWVMLCTQ